MTRRPILFSTTMVRALLAGTKTQTRRVSGLDVINAEPYRFEFIGVTSGPGEPHYAFRDKHNGAQTLVRCRNGQPGDQLWVRETWSGTHAYQDEPPSERVSVMTPDGPMLRDEIWYWADGEPNHGDWERPRPSIHMPRWASRITLEITGVRVERLQDISEADALAEGIVPHVRGGWHWHPHNPSDLDDWHQFGFKTANYAYESLWEEINGPGSWDLNPWVWVIEFRRLP